MKPTRSAALLLCVLLAGADAQGQSRRKEPPRDASGAPLGEHADQLKDGMAAAARDKAKQLYSEKKYAEALSFFQLSYQSKPDPSQLYNMGRCYQFLDRWPEALDAYERFSKDAPADVKARVQDLEGFLREVRSHVAQIDLSASVDGASVIVNDKISGTTPLKQPLMINAGPVRLLVQLEGYAPYKREFSLRGEEKATLDIHLISKNRAALLVLKSRISGAEAFVDGKSVGNPPLEVQVESGTHRIRVEHPSYKKIETTAVVSVGEKKELTLDPIDDTPVTKRWWFWASIGVGVAAASAATYMVLVERNPDKGGISPGVAAGP